MGTTTGREVLALTYLCQCDKRDEAESRARALRGVVADRVRSRLEVLGWVELASWVGVPS